MPFYWTRKDDDPMNWTLIAWLMIVTVVLATAWRVLRARLDVCGRCSGTYERSEMLEHPMEGPLCPSCSRDRGITQASLRAYRRRIS